MECLLDADVNKCPHYNSKGKKCLYTGKCSFQKAAIEQQKSKYIRKERWYEKYYK